MKKGNQVWLLGHLKSTRKIYEKETAIYKDIPNHVDHIKQGSNADVAIVDLMEVFAGRARVSELAHHYGLSSSQPFDKTFGIDLKSASGIKLLKGAVRKLKPLLLLVAWPCTFWSLFNENMNYSQRLEVLESLREEEMPLVDLGVDLCLEQDREGRYYLGENPLRSRIWKRTRVQELEDLPNNLSVTCEAGAYGAETRDGYPIQKPHKWVTNSEHIAQQLTAKLTPEQKYYTTRRWKDQKQLDQVHIAMV